MTPNAVYRVNFMKGTYDGLRRRLAWAKMGCAAVSFAGNLLLIHLGEGFPEAEARGLKIVIQGVIILEDSKEVVTAMRECVILNVGLGWKSDCRGKVDPIVPDCTNANFVLIP